MLICIAHEHYLPDGCLSGGMVGTSGNFANQPKDLRIMFRISVGSAGSCQKQLFDNYVLTLRSRLYDCTCTKSDKSYLASQSFCAPIREASVYFRSCDGGLRFD
jgi:hypothetical protein